MGNAKGNISSTDFVNSASHFSYSDLICSWKTISFPLCPSTTTEVIIASNRPAFPSNRISSVVIIASTTWTGRSGTAHRPASDFYVCALRLSCGFPITGTSFCTPKTTPVLFGIRLHSQHDPFIFFLAQPARLSSGIVARQFLQVTVRAHR